MNDSTPNDSTTPSVRPPAKKASMAAWAAACHAHRMKPEQKLPRGFDSDWTPGRPFDKHRHLCRLCSTGVVMWSSSEDCSPVHDDHHQGACARCRKKLGRREVQRQLAALRAYDAARERKR